MINFKKMLLRMKRALGKIRLRQSAVNGIAVFVVVALALYLALQISKNISSSVSTLKAQEITDTNTLSLKGYIFRNEKVYYGEDGKIADYQIDSGERVGVGKQVAELYSVSAGQDADSLQSELNSLSDRIRLLQKGISEAKRLSQASQIFDQIDSSYYSYLSAIRNGSYSVADKEGELLLDAINSYMIATGRTEEAQSVVRALEQQKSELIAASLSGAPTAITMEQSCYFYTECDGYEEIFDYSAVPELTPKTLAELTSAEKREYSGAIGKQVFSPEWYICFPMSDELCDMFVNYAEGESARAQYEAKFISNNGETVTLTYKSATYSDGAGNSGFVTFSSKEMPTDFDFLRAQNVQIELDSTTGYRVPEESVYTDGQKNYVYVLSGNTVEQRGITIIGRSDGYYIVNTYEADYAETGGNGLVPYLSVNELIITSGGDLYDGKLLK